MTEVPSSVVQKVGFRNLGTVSNDVVTANRPTLY